MRYFLLLSLLLLGCDERPPKYSFQVENDHDISGYYVICLVGAPRPETICLQDKHYKSAAVAYGVAQKMNAMRLEAPDDPDRP